MVCNFYINFKNYTYHSTMWIQQGMNSNFTTKMNPQFIGDFKTPTILEIWALITLVYLFVYKPVIFLLSWLKNNCCRNSRILIPTSEFDYAVITGSSDGIGLEYARQLAQKGYRLVLLSRTEEKLKRVAQEIQEQYPQCKKIDYMAVDFSRTDIYDSIKLKLETLDGPIRILVNNVGMAFPYPEYFVNYPDQFNIRLINTNIVSVTEMSQIVLNIMLKQRYDPSRDATRGVVINISSVSGYSEIPLFSTYSSSKSYVNFLSKILAFENAKDHIIVQTVSPNQVATNLTDVIEESITVKAVDCVRHALASVGTEPQTHGHPLHKLINGFSTWFGGLIGERLFMRVKFMASQNYRKKYEREQAAKHAATTNGGRNGRSKINPN